MSRSSDREDSMWSKWYFGVSGGRSQPVMFRVGAGGWDQVLKNPVLLL